jgi:hypothetical protein
MGKDWISNLVLPCLSPVFHEPRDKRISSYSPTLCHVSPGIPMLSPVIRNSTSAVPLSDFVILHPSLLCHILPNTVISFMPFYALPLSRFSKPYYSVNLRTTILVFFCGLFNDAFSNRTLCLER